MDPQMLNGKPHLKSTPCPEFVQQFLLRVQDVIDSYSPDILNFDDGASLIFDAGGQVGSGSRRYGSAFPIWRPRSWPTTTTRMCRRMAAVWKEWLT